MGVRIGTVTAVVPEGDRVRVAMEYDDEYKLPADAKAAIVTPTLTADRFVQIAPAYTGAPVLEDKAKIALDGDRDAGRARPDLPEPLGPDPGARPQRRQQERRARRPAHRRHQGAATATASSATRPCSTCPQAVQTFGDNSGALFDSVENMSQLTDTLAANDRIVDSFMSDLTSVSSQLADERGNLRQGADRAGPRRRDRADASCTTTRRMVRDRRPPADRRRRGAGQAEGVAEHGGPTRRPGTGQPGDRLRRQDRLDRGPGPVRPERRQPRQRAVRHRGELRGHPERGAPSPASCSRRSSSRSPTRRGEQRVRAAESPQLKLGGTLPGDLARRACSARLKAGEPMRRLSTTRARTRRRPARMLAGLVAVLVTGLLAPAASSTAPTTCRCPATRSTRTTPTRSPPTSPTRSTSCPARQ